MVATRCVVRGSNGAMPPPNSKVCRLIKYLKYKPKKCHGPSHRYRWCARRFSIFFGVACGWQWITVTQRGMPSVVIGSKCFPWLWRDVEAHHASLDDIFIAQFGSTSSTRRVIELAAEDILGQATIFHMMDVAEPSQTPLPYDSSKVIWERNTSVQIIETAARNYPTSAFSDIKIKVKLSERGPKTSLLRKVNVGLHG